MADKVYFKLELEGATRERAKTVGMDYDAIINGCGLTSNVWESAKRLYKNACKAEGYDTKAQIGAMKVENYKNLCLGFMIDQDMYKVEPKKAVVAVSDIGASPLVRDIEDVRLEVESLSAKLDTTNYVLGEIRNAIQAQKPTNNSDVVGKLDKLLSSFEMIKTHTSVLANLDKNVNIIKKADTSMDARLGGINQIIASAGVNISKIKQYLDRFASGK